MIFSLVHAIPMIFSLVHATPTLTYYQYHRKFQGTVAVALHDSLESNSDRVQNNFLIQYMILQVYIQDVVV